MRTKNCTRSVDLVQYKLQPDEGSGFLVVLVEKQNKKNRPCTRSMLCTDEDIFVTGPAAVPGTGLPVPKNLHKAQVALYVT
eukprot:SAG11_NODE_21573_length_422_cov_3.105263_1_plen_81_part_00